MNDHRRLRVARVSIVSTDINFHHEHSRLDSASLSRWQGLPLAWLDVSGSVGTRIVSPLPVLALIDAGTADADISYGARSTRLRVRPGSIGLFDADAPRRSDWRCRSARRIMVELDLPGLVRRGLAPEAWRHLRLRRALEFQDPAMAGLMRLMVREVAEGCPSGALVAESLSVGLAAHVVQHHADGPAPRLARGTLTRAQLHRIDDFIDAGLAGPLTLAQLAAEAALSAPHFARLFRRSTGDSPHQYVLRKRVERARMLMSDGEQSLAEVALAAGFASQSHMTTVFRRLLGATPGIVRAWRSG